MKLKLNNIEAAYKAMKKRAFDEFEKGDVEKCFFYMDAAATLACQVISRYTDDDFEELLNLISQKTILTNQHEYKPNENRVVFYDGFGVSYILAVQYMNALVSMGKEVLYIYEVREHLHNKLVPVLELFKSYSNVSIQLIEIADTKTEKNQKIYNSIVDFQPSKLFTHIDSHSAIIPVLYSLPKGLIRYHINLGDHLFWLGAKGIDYIFEFRNFGAVVSNEKRGLKESQIFLLPYYPLVQDSDFLGFPEEVRDKVVIFSGGDFYKTIDKENSYWELVKALLNENPNAVFLFASKTTEYDKQYEFLNNFIKTNGFQKRLLSIGFRPDINQVFAHCDIFMGTSPMSGGLMSQYAAVNAKPILQFYPPELFCNNETESVICFHDKISISHTDKQSFLSEAKNLIDNEEYRLKVGANIKSCMIVESEFNTLFAKSLETHNSAVVISKLNINYKEFTQWWLDIGNRGYYDVYSFIYYYLKIWGIFEAPGIISKYLFKRYFSNKLLSLGWYKTKIMK